jgi:hypothetical protein
MKKLHLLGLLAMLSFGCRDRNTNRVPDVPVNLAINIQQPDFFNLSVVTGWVYVTGGSRGIIIYRKSETEFVAIERHSTYLPENTCAVNVQSDGIIIQDPCSASQWLITDGTLVNGPASMPLVTYDTNFSSPILYVTN